jgi:hypothetical protein
MNRDFFILLSGRKSFRVCGFNAGSGGSGSFQLRRSFSHRLPRLPKRFLLRSTLGASFRTIERSLPALGAPIIPSRQSVPN